MSDPALRARWYRCIDAIQVLCTPSRRPLHRAVRQVIAEARRGWPSADYGAGYLYQSCPAVGLRGFRRTDARLSALDLAADLHGRSVLEIGCNSGFLSLALAPGSGRFLAFDNNPYLIRLARLVGHAVGDTAVEFRVESVETLPEDERFDVVLSFANHSTWDGNMTMPLDNYFAKLQRLLVPGGLLCFESHHPALESEKQLQATVDIMARYFQIQERRVLNAGSAWDRGRSLVKAQSLRDH